MPEPVEPPNGPTPTNPDTGAVDPAPANGPQPGNQPAPAKPTEAFPANTPVADMTDAQQVAYWKHQARKHEDRAKNAPTDAELTELRAARDERDQLKHAQMTDAEKAVADARAEGRQAAAAEYGERLVTAEFTAAAAGRSVPVEQLVPGLDKTKFLNSQGEPDRDAIRAFVDALAPAAPTGGAPQEQRGPDLEQGYRPAPTNKPTTASGADAYAAWANKK